MKKYLILALLYFLLVPFIRGNEKGNDSYAMKEGNESFTSSELKVFPNPVQNRNFTIELSSDKIVEIRISNIAGSLVYRKTLPLPAFKFQVITENIPNGIYLLKVTSVNHFSRTIKLMINNP